MARFTVGVDASERSLLAVRWAAQETRCKATRASAGRATSWSTPCGHHATACRDRPHAPDAPATMARYTTPQIIS